MNYGIAISDEETFNGYDNMGNPIDPYVRTTGSKDTHPLLS